MNTRRSSTKSTAARASGKQGCLRATVKLQAKLAVKFATASEVVLHTVKFAVASEFAVARELFATRTLLKNKKLAGQGNHFLADF